MSPIPKALVSLAIDEFPALSVAAACADGDTVLVGAEELRVKESDRIDAMVRGLRAVGIDATPTADGMVIRGGPIAGGAVNSQGDHRIAMAFSMAALKSRCPVIVENCENVGTSFPGFVGTARTAGLAVDDVEV